MMELMRFQFQRVQLEAITDNTEINTILFQFQRVQLED